MDQVIGTKYRVSRVLGQGGMGVVYEAHHLGTGRRVALKVIVTEALAKGGDIITRFEREARASGSIDSQHVVQVLDTGVDETTKSPYMVMEYLSGEDLQQLLERTRALDPDVALRVAAQACLGLQRAHEAGIVHRDIKSANIFLSRRDRGEVLVKILDFGIAKVRADQFSATENQGLTRTGAMMGSPLYMSPEQAMGAKGLDGASDIWSLGIVMYEALTGGVPNGHCDTIGSLIMAICSARTTPVQDRAPWVRPEVAAIVHKALAHDPTARFGSAAEMYSAIVALLPNGVAVHETMLVPLSDEKRQVIAPRLDQGIAPNSGGASGLLPLPPASAGAVWPTGSTTAGLGSDVHPRPRRSSLYWGLPLLGIAALAIAVGANRHHTETSRPPNEAVAATSLPVVSTAPLPTPVVQMVQVDVVPVDATVEVDGVTRPVRDGQFVVEGSIGSVHRVRIGSGTRETTTNVVIAENGAIPARVELVAPPAQRPATTAAASKSAPKEALSTHAASTNPPVVAASASADAPLTYKKTW